MTVVSTMSFAPYFVDQVVADQAGDLYMSGQGYIREFTPSGTLVKSLQLPFGAPYDMSISPTGEIVISGYNEIGLTDLFAELCEHFHGRRLRPRLRHIRQPCRGS